MTYPSQELTETSGVDYKSVELILAFIGLREKTAIFGAVPTKDSWAFNQEI